MLYSPPRKYLSWVIFLCCYRYGSCSSSKVGDVVRKPHLYQGVNLGPVRLFPRGFSWRASVDRRSGICNSRETSLVSSTCSLGESLGPLNQKQKLKKLASLWSLYPTWLAKGSVTLGLLQAVSGSDGSVGVYFLGKNVITFGRCQAFIVNDELIASLPIEGGFMTTQHSRMFRNPSKRGHPPRPARSHYGALSIRLKKNDEEFKNYYQVSTTIDGYRACLVGEGSPSSFRKWFYLSSQSMLHAYVMWRFHHFAQKQVTD